MRSAILTLLLATAAWAQNLNVDIPYQKFGLNNGLTLIVHEDHKAPIVAVNIWYHVGSKNEKPGKTGFAHLFEHLMFGGSEHVKMRYINALEQVGATDLNGTTNNDRTNYFETVPTSALDYTLFLESDRMGHLIGSFDKATLDLQRGVVQNEKRQGENQPYGVSEQLITENTYPPGHPYSWTVIGSMDDLNAASMDDVPNWFKTYYGPSNAVLVLAGDIDPKTAKEKVEKYFGDIPPGPPLARPEAWVAKMTSSHRAAAQDRVPQGRVYKVWNVPQLGTADNDFLDLVSDCFGQGKSSRLYKRLVYDEQLATNVFVYVDSKEIGSQFTVIATSRPGQDLGKIEAVIDEEVARFIEHGPTPEELDRVKTQYTAGFVRGLERVGGFGGKSDVLASFAVYTGDPENYKPSLRNHQVATAEDLRGAAQRWLSDGSFVLDITPYPALTAATSGVDRSTLPATPQPTAAKLPRIERATLSNGLKIMLAERHELPLVNLRMIVDAGYAADQFGIPGTARLAMTVLTDGTKTRNALEISDELRALGAESGAYSSLDVSNVRVSALKPKLDATLAIYADIILNPTFPAKDFEREQKQLLAAIEQEQAQPFTMAYRVFPGLLYGKGHAYSNPLTGSGTPADVARITREDLVKFHATWFHPNGATLLIVGDTTMAEIKPKLETLFAGWKAAELPKKNLAKVQLQTKPSVYLIDRPGSLQSMIMAGHIGPPRNNPQEIALAVLNDNIGGTFSGRVNMNLREDKHWAYGAFSMFFDAKGQGPFIAIAPVQTDKTKESMAEMNREIKDVVGTRPITADELQKAVSNRVLSLPGSRETIDSVSQSMGDLAIYGLPDDYYDTYEAKLKSLRTADLNDAAKSVIHPESLTWIVVGDRAKVEQGIRDLGIGPVQIIDADGNPAGAQTPSKSTK
jgi:zinc protease